MKWHKDKVEQLNKLLTNGYQDEEIRVMSKMGRDRYLKLKFSIVFLLFKIESVKRSSEFRSLGP